VGFPTAATETFTADEVRALAPYFTNTDRPVFALTNLPETVKGALFARYSRSAKSVRRLFLDEFLGQIAPGDAVHTSTVGTERADKLYAVCSASTATIRWRSLAAPTSPAKACPTS
jgi:hypothetical protein